MVGNGAGRVKIGNGWHDRLTWPLIVGVILVLASGLFETARSGAESVIDGCAAQAKLTIALGEERLLDRKLDGAEDLAQEVLVTDPDCRCAHLLMAKVLAARLTIAPHRIRISERRRLKTECYRHAKKAEEIGRGASAEIQALYQRCSSKLHHYPRQD